MKRRLQQVAKLFLIFVLVILISPCFVSAENSELTANQSQTDEFTDPHQAILASLKEKLTTSEGNSITIAILPPLDYTDTNLSGMIGNGLKNSLMTYGITNVNFYDYQLEGITKEDLQFAAYQTQAEIILISILTQYQFELFIFDNATPDQIFTSSQPVPDPHTKKYTMQAVQFYTDLLVSRTLSLYANGYYYELPSKIPEQAQATPQVASDKLDQVNQISAISLEGSRGIASKAQPKSISESRFYLSPALGGIYGFGQDSAGWTHYLFSLQFGLRVSTNLFAEFAVDHFSYNALSLSGKYFFPSSGSLGLGVGLGVSRIIDRFSWEGQAVGNPSDPTPTRQQAGWYLTPSLMGTYSAGDFHFKLEARGFIGGGGKMIFAIMPGIITTF